MQLLGIDEKQQKKHEEEKWTGSKSEKRAAVVKLNMNIMNEKKTPTNRRSSIKSEINGPVAQRKNRYSLKPTNGTRQDDREGGDLLSKKFTIDEAAFLFHDSDADNKLHGESLNENFTEAGTVRKITIKNGNDSSCGLFPYICCASGSYLSYDCVETFENDEQDATVKSTFPKSWSSGELNRYECCLLFFFFIILFF